MVSIDIALLSPSLVMYGEPDPASAYSLSGHVSILIPARRRRRPTCILLQSITLTFEGQTEIFTPKTGYSSSRIYSITRDISPVEPLELSNEGHEDSEDPCVWNVVFDLPIPGWLPQSTTFGAEDFGIRYSLFIDATFSYIDDNESASWSLATLCAPFLSSVRSTSAEKRIVLERLISSPEHSSNLIRTVSSGVPESDGSNIPVDVLSKIQIFASLPHHVNMMNHNFPLTIRMRAKDLQVSQCRRLRLTAVAVNIVQHETYRTRPSSDYRSRNPLPPRSQQPPNLPLRNPHPYSAVYDLGLCQYDSRRVATRSCSLSPSGEYLTHSLGEDNYPFVNGSSSPTWYTLEIKVPFIHCDPEDECRDDLSDWDGCPIFRPSISSPLATVRHEIYIHLSCSYDLPDCEEVAEDLLDFSIPISFARFSADHHAWPLQGRMTGLPAAGGPSLPLSSLREQSLPAYSHLFDYNGDPKVDDYSVPLPLYTPHSCDYSTVRLDAGCKESGESEIMLSTALI